MRIQIGDRAVWLNYHHLYYFLVISLEGGISKASAKLGIGQPALSAQLRVFEDSIGVSLFERHHKRLVLTETGKVVQEYAQEIFRMGSEMVEVVHDKLPAKRVHVQLGALDSIPKHVSLALSEGAMRAGNCVISILEGKADELLRELVAHRIDLIVTNFVPTLLENKGLYARSIAKAPVLVCGSSKFKGLKRGFPGSLAQVPFIVPTSHSKLRHDIEHYFKLAGIHIDIIAETQDTAIQKLLGIAGHGVIPVPLPAAQEYLEKKDLYELGRLEGVTEELFLVTASRKIANPIASHLMKSFKLKL